MMYCFTHVFCEVAIVRQLCFSYPYVLHGLCEDYLTCDIAFNAVIPLSRASTRGRYSRIEGVTASHDDHGRQAGASPRSVLLSSLVQREQAQAGASSKGTRFGATRPGPAQRQGRGHCGAPASVTTRAFGRRGPTLVTISVPDVPLQNGQLLAPFPLNIWEEAQGLCL